MHIIDNFLPPSLFNDIETLLMSSSMDWSYVDGATMVDGKPADEFYFVHRVLSADGTSPLFNQIKPLLYFMDDRLKFFIDNLIRINCTMCTNQGKAIPQAMHTDFPFPHYTGIFYVNTNNGPTIVEDTKVDSVANRFVLFDGTMNHAASLQDDTRTRVNIVFNMQGHFRD